MEFKEKNSSKSQSYLKHRQYFRKNWLGIKVFQEIERNKRKTRGGQISANRAFGPYFFETNVNKENYLEMIKSFFWPKLLNTLDYKKYYFQQDGATPHTADIVQSWYLVKNS